MYAQGQQSGESAEQESGSSSSTSDDDVVDAEIVDEGEDAKAEQ